MKPQLTIVIPTLNAGLGLKTSLNAVLQQQTAPTFEVLIVSQWPFAEVEAELPIWDARFKYLCSGQKGINAARNLGLNQAVGDFVLFLDDESWLDDRLFLKKHIDAHLKSPEAIGVGGWYRRKIDANHFETAYYASNGWRVAKAKIDAVRTTTLAGGNMSFKTTALRSAFSFDENSGLGASTKSLTDRLISAGHELHFSERLAIEHRPRMSAVGLLYRAINQGRGKAQYEKSFSVTNWKFAGSNLTRARYMQEAKIALTPKLGFALWLYDFGFAAGVQLSKTNPGAAPIALSASVKALCREFGRRLKAVAYSRSISGLFIALREQLGKN